VDTEPEGEQVQIPTFTTSERRAAKRCIARWWWEYREGLRPPDPNIKLWFGIGIHEALAVYYGRTGYKRDRSYIDRWREYCDADEYSRAIRVRLDDTGKDESEWMDARALGENLLLEYPEWWGGDPNWDVIATERPFAIEIPDPDDPDQTVGIFKSTFDGVYRDKSDGRIRLMEHKTTTDTNTSWLALDDQGGAYWALAPLILRDSGVLGPRDSIHSIQYNFIRKAKPDDRPRNAAGLYLNQNGSVSKVQPKPRFFRPDPVRRTKREQATQIRRIADELLALERFRTGELRITKTPTRDCHWDCAFFQMCQLHEMGGPDWTEYRDAVYLVEDPYSRYKLRKSASS